MRILVMRGIIDRRILANFRIDPEVMARNLPSPFRPKLIRGQGIGGICLIRLQDVRPRFSPCSRGLTSENAAHRFAVEWDVDGETYEGVYIPRRDTDSRINAITGGTIFPGVHRRAAFDVEETGSRFSVALQSDDGETRVRVEGRVTRELPKSSIFGSVEEASTFFERGSLGYSPSKRGQSYEGLELACENWNVEALDVESIESSFFEDEALWPSGSVNFDCALLMRGIDHEWRGREALCCPTPAGREGAAIHE